jgi:hypothetical protein
VAQANGGDAEALARLRAFLDANPWLWQQAGDLTAAAEGAWLGLIAGPNHLVAESVKRRLAALKDDLKGPHAGTLEALLVDVVAVAWLALQDAELGAARPAGGSLAQAAFRLKRAESCQRRFASAVKTLAGLRALAPQGLVPARPLQVFGPERRQA